MFNPSYESSELEVGVLVKKKLSSAFSFALDVVHAVLFVVGNKLLK